MGECFEVEVKDFGLKEDAHGVERNVFAILPPAGACEQLTGILKRYDKSYLAFVAMLSRDAVGFQTKRNWAFLFMPQDYALGGHMVTIRKDKDRLPFGYYGHEPRELKVFPSAGYMIVPDKNALASAASRSPVFAPAWEAMKDLDEDKHYFCFLDPIHPELLKMLSEEDDRKYREHMEQFEVDLNQSVWHHPDFETAREAEDKEDFATMMRHASAVHAVHPHSPQACVLLGNAQHHLGMDGEAMSNYEHAIKLKNTAYTRKRMAQASDYERFFARTGMIGEEQIEERQWKLIYLELETAEAEALAWCGIAAIHEDSGRGPDALQSYHKAYEIMPGCLNALHNLNRILSDLGQHEDTIEICEKLTQVQGGWHASWAALGYAYGKMGRNREAQKALLQAEELEPRDPQMLYGMGLSLYFMAVPGPTDEPGPLEFAFIKEMQLQEGIHYFTHALRACPEHADAWTFLGSCHYQLERYPEAIEAFEKAREHKPEASSVWNDLGMAFARAGRLSEATEACHKALELDPESAEAWDSLGFSYGEAGDYDEAVAALEKAIELNPDYPPALENLTVVCARNNQIDQAEELRKKLGEVNPIKARELGDMIRTRIEAAGRG